MKQEEFLEQSGIRPYLILFENHPHLINCIFELNYLKLKNDPENIIALTRGLSSGERILIRIALDLWNGSGAINLIDIIDGLDEQNYKSFLKALNLVRQ